MTVDPVTRELVSKALTTIADNMVVTVMRTARSHVVKQSLDFSTAICDADGQLVAQGLSLPVHLGAIMPALEGVLRHYRGDVQPGDVFINNDPYEGGSHLPDIFLFKPVFFDGVLLGYLAVIAHQTDIGGRVAGGNACDSTEIFQEGLRIPPLKLFWEGRPDPGLFRLIRQNVRVPDRVLGDLRAQLAALHVGERELLDLARQYGAEELRGYMAELIAYTERLTRAELAALPAGEAEFADYIDDDGITSEPIRIQVRLRLGGGEVAVDFSGTSPQARGAINPNFAFTCSCVYAAVRCLLDPELPNNAGYFRPIKVYAPPGTFVHPLHPAPVAARALGGFRVIQTVLGALAQVVPDRIPACWGGGEFGISFGGYYPDRRPFVYLEFHNVSGPGGGPDADGVDGGSVSVVNVANTPVELIEADQPLLIEEYGLLPDTGGPGRYRGALGVVRQYRVLAEEATVQVRSDRRRFRPYGLRGGRPGSPCLVYLLRDGSRELLPAKCLLRLRAGEGIRVELAGAGGYGNPLERDPEAVARDVRDGKITPAHARDEYGVEVDPETLTPDFEATARRRGRGSGG
jgi:N-methylhydantoinase B